ncbi:glutamate receptor ionotropic, kainate 2-like isoform X2 [Planococcus citri]|uniref:glutamate receptor ionotropic, kainate 2-like isoform X2 n=1 Tax=Planococcus citri TaxID=170843 RepID=UPI0031F82C39
MHNANVLYIFMIIGLSPCLVHNRDKDFEKHDVKILGLFGPEDEEEMFVFRRAVEDANTELKRTQWNLIGDVIYLETYDSFALSNLLCDKLQQSPGYGAIFGPDNSDITNIVRSITSTKKIPHIDTRWDTSYSEASEIYINLYPESSKLAKAIGKVLQDMDWETFTLIYETPESLINLQEVLKEKMGRSLYERPTVIMKQLPEQEDDYKPFLKEIKNSSETHIMLHCSPESIVRILEKAKQIDLVGPYQNFFLTSLDAHTIDFKQFRTTSNISKSQANITTLRLVNPENVVVKETVQKWYRRKIEPTEKMINITEYTIKTDTAMMHDAIILFTQALKDMPRNFTTDIISCNFPESTWEQGPQIMNKMKSIEFEGLTGEMEYETNGKRKYFALEIIEATTDRFRVLGSYDPLREIRHSRNASEIQKESSLSIANKTLRVVSKIVAPYLTYVNESDKVGNDRFQGFCKDLLHELSELLKFDYILEIPANTEAGVLNRETGRYSGLIGELRELRADLAICDFTITPERKKAVDFTAPFMSIGIGILYSVTPAKETSYFSFLDPFDHTVWIYVVTAFLALSIVKYIIARCSPYEWEGEHSCDQEPEELENAWNLRTTLWFGLGSLLTQGCDILPKGVSARITASAWWFFALIITSTYTANLAAFLTTQRMESPIKNVEDLANQDAVKYGCVQKGATFEFFKNTNDSLYQRMWATMESANPSVFTENNDKGVERVMNSRHKYAFFMESSSIKFEIQTKCGLTQIGSLLDSKFYGIALPMSSSYKDALSGGILALKENSKLEEIHSRWWTTPEDKHCEDLAEVDDAEKDKLGIANVGGVFLLLILGCGFAFFMAILEFLWNVRKVAVRERITLSDAFWLEVKFAFKCNRSTKPIRHTPQSNALGTPLSVSQIGFINRNL